MTDRILSDFHAWVRLHPPTDAAPDLTMHMGRHARPVIRHMWAAWQAQAERITDMAAALDRSYKRSTELLKQCRDHDTRRVAAVQQAQALADEVARLNETIAKLAAEGQDAHEM